MRRYARRSNVKRTPAARALEHALKERGVRVLSEIFDGFKHIDLGIPSARLNIEVDGRHHLTSCKQMLADIDRGQYSAELGYATIHIHNQEIIEDLPAIADAIAGVAIARAKRFARKNSSGIQAKRFPVSRRDQGAGVPNAQA